MKDRGEEAENAIAVFTSQHVHAEETDFVKI
jgi:hypothetical protein